MARFGIRSSKALGVSTPMLRAIAKRIGRDHALAQDLWRTGILEARAVASLIGDPKLVTEELMEAWVADFDSWAVCDGACCNLFDKTKFAWKKALEWSRRDEEYVKRAGYTLMAALAVHDKAAADEKFLRFLPAIRRGATDERNFVKKAVNWALRQIGKRNRKLNRAAILAAREIRHDRFAERAVDRGGCAAGAGERGGAAAVKGLGRSSWSRIPPGSSSAAS